MASVYLETSFVSACVTTRTDVASLYRRETSLEWWSTEAPKHSLCVSAEVLEELSDPSYPQRSAALELIRDLPLLAIDEAAHGFAQVLVAEHVMPMPLRGDALHVAVACVHRVDYVLSWNVRHLANPNKIAHLAAICLRWGILPPRIVTPDLLWGETDE